MLIELLFLYLVEICLLQNTFSSAKHVYISKEPLETNLRMFFLIAHIFVSIFTKPVAFYHGPFVKKGRDQHVAILLLLFSSSHLLDQSEQSINLDALL
jgi:hypothetical protein